eukprot:768351-Hanusia_phi.AAC.4
MPLNPPMLGRRCLRSLESIEADTCKEEEKLLLRAFTSCATIREYPPLHTPLCSGGTDFMVGGLAGTRMAYDLLRTTRGMGGSGRGGGGGGRAKRD